MALPDLAARHARLGHGNDARALRRDVQRQAAQNAGAGKKNGMFFVLDRTNGKDALSSLSFRQTGSQGWDKKRRADSRRRISEPQPDGVLVSGGVGTNWQAPSFDPETGLFYVNSREAMGVFYLTMPGKDAEGWAGRDFFLGSKSMLKAIDYQTGKIRWKHTQRAAAANPASSPRRDTYCLPPICREFGGARR